MELVVYNADTKRHEVQEVEMPSVLSGSSLADFGTAGSSAILIELQVASFDYTKMFIAKFVDSTNLEQAILLNETIKIEPVSYAAGTLTVRAYSIAAVSLYNQYEFIWRIL